MSATTPEPERANVATWESLGGIPYPRVACRRPPRDEGRPGGEQLVDPPHGRNRHRSGLGQRFGLRELAAIRSGKEMHLQHGFHGRFEVEQRMKQEGEQHRARTPAHPTEEQGRDEYFRNSDPVVLQVQRGP
jgi:hypothetical protein